MRRSVLLLCFLAVTGSATAAFTCEQIAAKATRTACIAERTSKEKDALVAKEQEKEREREKAKEQAEADEKERVQKAAVLEKENELDAFVKKSKDYITRNYKDPLGAQFTSLVVSDSSFRRSLCGYVNGKNSYGAFVGARRFFIQWWPDGKPPEVWYEFASTSEHKKSQYPSVQQRGREIDELEAKLYGMVCSASVLNTITKIDK